jgi:hypothetical protein
MVQKKDTLYQDPNADGIVIKASAAEVAQGAH